MKSKLPEIGTTIFSVMSALAVEHDAINLSQGFPNFKIDPKLKEYVKVALDNEQVQYAPMPGRLDLRQEISKKLKAQHNIDVDPQTEITISAGATQGIYSAIAATIQNGDEVILFDPAYDCYNPSIRLHGGIPIHLKLTFPEYSIDWNEVRNRLNDKTRMIIVNNPHNPAGTVWTKSDLDELEKIVLENDNIIVLSDEVYEHLQYDGAHQSVLKNEVIRSRAFVTYSFGKTFHVTGWKLGYTVAPRKLTEELRKMHQFNVFCVNNTMQCALAEYLKNENAWRDLHTFYQPKRDLFISGMESSRFKALNCQGTYFCLYDYSDISNETDVDFSKRITKEFGVASIPISVFYNDQTDNKVVRFCFAKTDETLIQATEKLCKI